MNEPNILTLATVRRLGQGDAHLDADPTYARLVMRRISPWVTYFVVRHTRLSADAVTLLAIGCGIAGGLLTAGGTAEAYLAAIGLLQLAYLLDVADGEVARVRGTAGKRGTYLDLVGHFLQNRALYAGSTFALIEMTGFAVWAIALALVGVGLASPFGEQARNHVLGLSGGASPHGARSGPESSPPFGLYGVYRRLSFVWNYPASMNIFCVALALDVARIVFGAPDPLVLPIFAGAFVLTLSVKQLANALRLLRPSLWSARAAR
jgi:phosphatidylglycerophosphate synthase